MTECRVTCEIDAKSPSVILIKKFQDTTDKNRYYHNENILLGLISVDENMYFGYEREC